MDTHKARARGIKETTDFIAITTHTDTIIDTIAINHAIRATIKEEIHLTKAWVDSEIIPEIDLDVFAHLANLDLWTKIYGRKKNS